MNGVIEHVGVVVSVEEGDAKVLIEQTSACAGCHAKGACTAFDKAEKVIDAIVREGDKFFVGEVVMLQGKKSIGVKAVVLAFVLPFVIVLITLIVSLMYTDSEVVAAVVSLGILVPYYFFVYLFRGMLQREFKFYVSKRSAHIA